MITDARLDTLLAAADPAAGSDAALADDARACGDRARIVAAPRDAERRRRPRALRVATSVAGLAALVGLLVTLVIAVPGRDGGGATAGALAPRPVEGRAVAPRETFGVIDRGVSHSLGWAWNAPALAQLGGRPALVIGAGPGCDCDAVIAEAEAIWSGIAVGDLAVIGVAASSEDARWWRARGTTFPIVRGLDGVLGWTAYAPAPYAVAVVDRMGRVAATAAGPIAPEALRPAVEALLAEARPPVPPEPGLRGGTLPAPPAPLSVFDLPALPMPPPAHLERALARQGAYRDTVRIALRTPSGRTLWVARTGPAGVVMANLGPSGVAPIVSGSVAVRVGGLSSRGQDAPDEPHYAAGIVTDGYTEARAASLRAAVTNNVFILEDSRPIGPVTLTGPGLPPIEM